MINENADSSDQAQIANGGPLSLRENSTSAVWPRASTQVAAVIGDPVRHSLSPVLLNAAFMQRGMDWVYIAFEVPKGAGSAAVEAARTLGIRGMSVTMPHKEAVFDSLDGVSETAGVLRAVNTIVARGPKLFGENTDGEGFVNALREAVDWDPAGRDCIVFGAGGAARAVVLALASRGAASIGIVGRNSVRSAAAVSLAGAVGRIAVAEEVAAAQLIVNATPVGMSGLAGGHDARLLVRPEDLGSGQVVVDLVYQPRITRLLETAHSRGATAVGGVGMLVHQAAIAFKLWTGEEAPLQAMWDAVSSEGPKRS